MNDEHDRTGPLRARMREPEMSTQPEAMSTSASYKCSHCGVVNGWHFIGCPHTPKLVWTAEQFDAVRCDRDRLQAERDKLAEHVRVLREALGSLHSTCEIALAGEGDKQHAYFETRQGHFVAATEAMERAEVALELTKEQP